MVDPGQAQGGILLKKAGFVQGISPSSRRVSGTASAD
jgi:hypothetical protein